MPGKPSSSYSAHAEGQRTEQLLDPRGDSAVGSDEVGEAFCEGAFGAGGIAAAESPGAELEDDFLTEAGEVPDSAEGAVVNTPGLRLTGRAGHTGASTAQGQKRLPVKGA
ncbi:hypothetical protein Deipe_4281 (plasmid) [Deinococcus peraridilitoris DSM 19664]|uniref:Uncharacterized protein n=1 Tax=Deinococcus peraridilitoris (strain DSM 19664 / LMG 22246 / CIP 109416 / KR-200) TaxID=937777 RepID=L0A891_DEIPD|nr:hypothetical protein [Deinococcus peraridilitoris]AFZ69624.1 hypothetical protein Deipe_4281 [Deinococcus peraridilitoris DSM 19664]